MNDKKQLINSCDMEAIRDNLIINYILGDEQKLLLESYVKHNGIQLRFNVNHFYFLITGAHKKFVSPYTPTSFEIDARFLYTIYGLFDKEIKDCGYVGQTFMIKEDNSKQFAVLFSPTVESSVSPDEMAERLFLIHRKRNRNIFSSTSFVGPYAGYESIHKAFQDARRLNDLIFFGVKDCVITQEYYLKNAKQYDISATLAGVRRLTSIMCSGTFQQAMKQIDYIINKLIIPSYSYSNYVSLHIACQDMFSMFTAVYFDRIQIEQRTPESFSLLVDYRDYLHETICTIFEKLKGTHRYSPNILIALSYINKNYTSEISLLQISEYVYVNPSLLSRKFNTEVGMSLSEYVTNLRIQKAQELLQNTDLTVPEIARQTVFSSAKYFREIFKKQTGLSPQGYREQEREESFC